MQNIKKLEGGTLWGQKKISKKRRTVPKKTLRGDPIVSSCFVSYDKNGLTERGDPLHYLKCAASVLVVLYLVQGDHFDQLKFLTYQKSTISDLKKNNMNSKIIVPHRPIILNENIYG